MLKTIYLTLSSLIAGGIANIIFTKTSLYRRYKRPIDGGRVWRDGKRIFGDNKTVVGGVSMVVFCAGFQVVCGLLCAWLDIERYNALYHRSDNTVWLNLLFGAAVGIVYVVCELPNSFIKRRLDIPAGEQVGGVKGVLFFVIDQIDSLVGVMAVTCLFGELTVCDYFLYLAVGALTHIAINVVLKACKLRRHL